MKVVIPLCKPPKPVQPPADIAMGVERVIENQTQFQARHIVELKFIHRGEVVQFVRMEASYAATLAAAIAEAAK